MNPALSTCTSSKEVALAPSEASKPSSTFSQIVRPSVSPGRIVSEVSGEAFLNASENPSAGTTAVARVTRSLTVTINASPSRCTDPAKIWRLFGPAFGKSPHADTAVIAAVNTTAFAHRF